MRLLSRACATAILVTASSCTCERPTQDTQAPRLATFAGDTLPEPHAQGARHVGGELRVAIEAEPTSLNCQLDPIDGLAKKIDALVLESLAQPDPVTWQQRGQLATDWTISRDKRSITFHLRQDVRWHDGEPFDAEDVLFTFDRLLAPSSKTAAMRSYLEPLTSYEKLDRYTVRFLLKRPYWYAFDAIAGVYVYPEHLYARGDFNTHPANRAPVGTGRFRFAMWKTGDEIVLARNERYYGDKAALDRLVFKYVPDPTVRLQMLRRGELDVIEKLTPQAWASASRDETLAISFWRLRHLPSGLQWIGWNQARPYFRDRRVRQALTMLIDRRDIVESFRLGVDRVAASWFFPGSKDYNDALAPWPYDPGQAARLLEQAGWRDSDGDGLRERDGVRFAFTFSYPAGNPFYEQLASLLQNALGRAGIKVETARLEWATYMERLRAHDFDACALLWQMAPRDDPYFIWHSSAATGGSNYVGFRHQEADQLLERARGELDEVARAALYRHLSEILRDEQPYTLLFNRYHLSLVSKKFGGIYSTPYGVLRYEDFYLRAESL